MDELLPLLGAVCIVLVVGSLVWRRVMRRCPRCGSRGSLRSSFGPHISVVKFIVRWECRRCGHHWEKVEEYDLTQ